MRGMRRNTQSAMELKAPLRKSLEADIERYLESGGVIQEIAPGVYGEKREGLTARQRLVVKQEDPVKARLT